MLRGTYTVAAIVVAMFNTMARAASLADRVPDDATAIWSGAAGQTSAPRILIRI